MHAAASCGLLHVWPVTACSGREYKTMSGHCRGAFKLIESEQSMTPDAMLVISLGNLFKTVTTNVLQNLPDIYVLFVESLNGAIKNVPVVTGKEGTYVH